MKSRISVIVLLILLLVMLVQPVLGGDPTGAITLAENPDAPVNFSWTLLCGILVMFMRAGFAMVETGLTLGKECSEHHDEKHDGLLPRGARLLGGRVRADVRDIHGNYRPDIRGFRILPGRGSVFPQASSTMELWFFQMVFAATAATIVSGAMAEQTKFSTYCIYSVVISTLISSVSGHWIWGGGWLNAADFMVALGGGYGALDFAGSGVVHALGGFVSSRRGDHRRATPGQIQEGRDSGRHTRPLHDFGPARGLHPVVRLVRVQSGKYTSPRPNYGSR